jgi:hypothetical protein
MPDVDFNILMGEYLYQSIPVAPAPDDHGFIVGGVNSTERIKNLKAFKTVDIATIEARMRPGRYSQDGFLGAAESLIDVLAADNAYVVDTLKLNHPLLAAPLQALVSVCRENELPNEFEFELCGQHFSLSYFGTRGFQTSPFDDSFLGSQEFTVTNNDTGATIKFADGVAKLIDKYGFYEGNTPWRVDPKTILAVFGRLYPKPQVQAAAAAATAAPSARPA